MAKPLLEIPLLTTIQPCVMTPIRRRRRSKTSVISQVSEVERRAREAFNQLDGFGTWPHPSCLLRQLMSLICTSATMSMTLTLRLYRDDLGTCCLSIQRRPKCGTFF